MSEQHDYFEEEELVKGAKMSKAYSTEELIDALSGYQTKFTSFLADRYVDAIISKLMAGAEYERKYAELVEVVSARTEQAK
ncbi:MAG: hypothetical protein PHC68_02580 [Syntrophorhabdaceae bacterium]|nr:hypothetical protein [Syntrophorhabdaceae bacterium]